MAATKLALPHFLNLPLPPIPTGQLKQDGSGRPTPPPPTMFKFTLSAEQFEELLKMDAEVEEGEEGGLRLEFDQAGKGRLHLNPVRSLQLNPPRSGPSKTNKPEEIYHHTTPTNPNPSRSPLAGLIRVPSGTPIFDLQRSPPDTSAPASSNLAPPRDLLSKSKPVPSLAVVQAELPTTTKATRGHPDSAQREKEKQAGQRLKDKRLEEERRKKGKQMVVLPDGPAPPVTKKGRVSKAKAGTKQTATSSNWSPNSSASASTTRTKTALAAPVPRPTQKRALPGSQAGKQLASEHNHQLSNSSTPIIKPASLDIPPPPTTAPQPLPAPPPPPVAFKKSSSNKKGKPPSLSPPDMTPKMVSSPEISATAKLSASTVLSSLSEETANSPPLAETKKPAELLQRSNSGSVVNKIPTKYIAPSKPTVVKRQSISNQASMEPQSAPVAPEVQEPSTTSKPVTKKVPNVSNTLNNTMETKTETSSINSSPSKKRRAEINPSHTQPAAVRPKKVIRRDGPERALKTFPPDDPVQGAPQMKPKTGVTVKRIVGAPGPERGGQPNKKRAPEQEITPVLPTKRVKAEEAALPTLPPIRKVNRVAERATEKTPVTMAKKKRKKIKQPIDYTSSEPEEGEESTESESETERQKYHNNRLVFHRLKKHYEYVCDRIIKMREGKIKMARLEEVEELINECYGLENELESMKLKIIQYHG